ncbi:hypothetical protein LSG31_05645 [Fodinisporobacter ferrooxydans]|uniref:Uncharacterized protein n=1 Tax=Fodinisporobacter ferrooxydans TaxID=2901836 RepID=A0ABY4CQM3_9BACL|nr:hypothetical protein LSG31_05645 [Alicyclobacillaceae bacterium MYW30-H2]
MNQDIERMKQLIEAKKKKNAGQMGSIRPDKKIGKQRKGVKVGKKGGLFDK